MLLLLGVLKLGKGCVVGYGCDFGAGDAAEEASVWMSGLEYGYCSDADVAAVCVVAEAGAGADAGVGVEMAWSSAMPGCAAWASVQTWPPLLDESLVLRGGVPFGLLAMTFSLVRVSSSALIGGLGSALFFCIGGLTRRGGVDTASLALTPCSFSSLTPLVALNVLVDRWTGSDNFLGLLLAGMLDMRSGMDGGPTGALLLEAM